MNNHLTRWKSPASSGPDVLDFRYGPLKSTKTGIRLAKIKPGSGNKGISIDLVDSFVSGPGQRQQEPYDALSYTWGETTRTKTLLCNGRRLPVTQTLLEALHHFREPDREVTIWIDQICICQDRVMERNQQVELMGKIFRGAQKVSVWLGPHYDDSRAGMQLAKQLLSISQQKTDHGLDPLHLESHGLPKRGHRRWKALAAILRRPWFWRTWIVQEVVLNPNVELVLGDSTIKWEDLEAIVGLLEGPTQRWQIDLTMSAWELPFSRINRIRLRHQKQNSDQPMKLPLFDVAVGGISQEPGPMDDSIDEAEEDLDLLDLLLLSRDLGATDPRDKVYALLGLSEHEIIPDYNSSPETVFSEFALHTIGEVTRVASQRSPRNKLSSKSREVRKALILFSCAGRHHQKLDLPSWAPDWTSNLSSRPLVFDSNFCAGGEVMEVLDWDHDTGLQLCGKLIDTVGTCGTVRLEQDPAIDSHELIRQWWAEAQAIALSRVVRSPGNTGHLDAFQKLCLYLSICDHGYYIDERSTRRRGNLLDEGDLTQDTKHSASQTLTLGSTRGRVLFVTTAGYVGLAPHGTQEGDLVYVVLGCPIPYILRPVPGGAFELIGEAYVQGIMMDGEALKVDDWTGVHDIFIR